MNESRPTPGQRLKIERERRGMSVEKTAIDMHLDAWAIDALEAGDYARVGPMVYAKGHLKRYAALLGLPVDEIMSDFEPVQPAAPAPERSKFPVGSRHTREPSRTVSPAQTAASLAAVFALIGVVWWQPWHREPAATPQAPGSAGEAPGPASAADADAAAAPATPDLTAESYAPRALATAATGGVVVAAPGVTAPRAAPADATAAAAPARARLRLSFTSDSWVDVRDAQGNRAFVGNGSANTVKTIAGTAPLHVYLRSASGVQLEINGRAVAIGPQFFSGNVARFEAGADGVLRREQTPVRPPG